MKKTTKISKTILCSVLTIIMILSTGLISANASSIGKTEAKNIALKDAGIKKSAAVFIEAKLKTDDGAKQYEIEFVAGKKSYEYEIKAKNGKILDKEVKKIKNPSKKFISKAKAKSIALKHKGFKKNQVVFKKCKLEIEKRYVVYEVEFYKNKRKFECDINAKNGKII